MNDITSKLVREQNGNSTENLGKKMEKQCEINNLRHYHKGQNLEIQL